MACRVWRRLPEARDLDCSFWAWICQRELPPGRRAGTQQSLEVRGLHPASPSLHFLRPVGSEPPWFCPPLFSSPPPPSVGTLDPVPSMSSPPPLRGSGLLALWGSLCRHHRCRSSVWRANVGFSIGVRVGLGMAGVVLGSAWREPCWARRGGHVLGSAWRASCWARRHGSRVGLGVAGVCWAPPGPSVTHCEPPPAWPSCRQFWAAACIWGQSLCLSRFKVSLVPPYLGLPHFTCQCGLRVGMAGEAWARHPLAYEVLQPATCWTPLLPGLTTCLVR